MSTIVSSKNNNASGDTFSKVFNDSFHSDGRRTGIMATGRAGAYPTKYQVVADNTWAYIYSAGGNDASGRKFKKGDIISGKEVTLSTPKGQMPAIEIGANEYLNPYQVVIALPTPTHSKAEGDTATTPTPVTTPAPVIVPPIMKALPTIIGSVGFIWGLGYSFQKEKGFWAYVGYSFLGSVIGTAVGGLITVVAYPSTLDGLRTKK